MKQLPSPLEPWRAWLTLFAVELAEPLGQLLLRLHPFVGRLNSATLQADDTPVGVGNIVQRGPYDRLLISEWAYADAEPDEFIRRAANNELMFTGPEPETRMRSRQCIVLFDAGPSQLGEPRLAQLALFILLARRAEEAGAQFQWGILQKPGQLHEDIEQRGIKILLAARTLAAPAPADINAWNLALASVSTKLRDCWCLSDATATAPDQVTTRVKINRELLENSLRVALIQRQSTRELRLELPEAAVGVRVLRDPFTSIVSLGRIRQASGRPSLKQAPRFSVGGSWLAVPQLDGGAIVFHVPQSTQASPGKFRKYNAPIGGSILAAAVFQKSFSHIVLADQTLSFNGFPGPIFSGKKISCARPEMEEFRAPVGMARWLKTFFLLSPKGHQHRERLLVLDIEKNLVCWEYSVEATTGMNKTDFSQHSAVPPLFQSIASNVIGAEQFNMTLVFACIKNEGTTLYRLNSHADAPVEIKKISHKGRRIIFGHGASWNLERQNGLLALQYSDKEWWVGNQLESHIINIFDDSQVLGVAYNKKSSRAQFGLVVLSVDKKTIQFRFQNERLDLFKSAIAIAQIAVDPDTSRIAWLNVNHELTVRTLDNDKPLLQVSVEGDPNAI